MSKLKIAVVVLVPLACAGLAVAQPAAGPDSRVPEMHRQRPDPAVMHKEMCSDRQAKEVGHLSYLEARLDLTEAQKPLFGKWRQSLLDSAAKQKASCLSETGKGPWNSSIVERSAHEEAMLAARLQTLQASHAALQALYDGLSPSQRQLLDHPRPGWDDERHHGWGGEDRHGGEPPPMPQPQ